MQKVKVHDLFNSSDVTCFCDDRFLTVNLIKMVHEGKWYLYSLAHVGLLFDPVDIRSSNSITFKDSVTIFQYAN